MMRITVLSENTAGGRDLIAEHGLALWIECGARRFLFDTGQGLALVPNAHMLEIDLATVDGVILSHGHYDHTGGVAQVLAPERRTPVYAYPGALEPKFSVRPQTGGQHIGMPERCADAVRQHGMFTPVTEPADLGEGLFLTGPIPRLSGFEDTGGPFFHDADGRDLDELIDDQALYYESADGIAVIRGCAHSGVVNTVRFVHELTGGRPIWALIGGMHLVAATATRLNQTVRALQEFDIQLLGPMHCTGPEATARLWTAFPGQCVPLPTGKTIDL
jgi:7,8-dihydropterin-6-yl-methyl-4-(beta-D-ribofuranosyl)aminobenzene 5'-phosphate synthase